MRTLRRFRRDRAGATAIKFALVAPLFLAIVFSTFEAGWMMVRATALDRALDIAIRKVRIGEDNGGALSQSQIKTAICDEMTLVVPVCVAALTVEMTIIKSASDIPSTAATCVDRGSGTTPTVGYTTGEPTNTLYVRACLVADPITPLLGLALRLPKDSKGGYSLVTSSAFIREPKKGT